MAEPGDIDLYLAGQLVAHTEATSRGAKVRIVHEPEVNERWGAEIPLLSCSIPTGRASEPAAAQAFLEGLLPEGRALETMAARTAGVQLELSETAPKTPYDAVRLLAAYGRECAGAIATVPRGEAPPGSNPGYVPLDAHSIGDLIIDLPNRPLAVDVTHEIRMSLAGAQPKLLLAFVDGRWHLPSGGAPSSHLMKPTGSWPWSADNECVVMTLARRTGLTSVAVRVEEVEGRRAFVTERFDREVTDNGIRRLHQEDFCQALKVRPKDKYHVGHLSARPVAMLRTFSSEPARDLSQLFRQMLFRAIVGDEDGHLKNYGLMLRDGRVRLAPLYDSLATVAYPQLTGRMGTPIGRQTHLFGVDREAVIQEGRAFGLTQTTVVALFEESIADLEAAIDGLTEDIADPRVTEIVLGIVRSRLKRLRDGSPMGRPSQEQLLGSGSGTGTLDQATRRATS